MLSQSMNEKFNNIHEAQNDNVNSTPRHSSSRATTPSRFFAHLYASQSQTNSSDDCSPSNNSEGRTPTKSINGLMSMWNNVKYGWSGKLRTNFSSEQPVWLLGRCYHRKSTPVLENSSESMMTVMSSSGTAFENGIAVGEMFDDNISEIALDAAAAAENQGNSIIEEGIDEFRRDFFSRLWITYRREFPTMSDSNYTSDCGWGCMLRSGQMLLAQGLICHFLGRNWRWDPETQLHTTSEDNYHRKIIRWFGDSSSRNCPFSIHQLVSLGQDMGKKPGDWYGPSSVSFLLRMAMQKASEDFADLENIIVYVAKDCTGELILLSFLLTFFLFC